MRMKKIVENRTLKSAAAEFIAFKRAQKIRERTLHDYQKYINPFVEQSSNSMDIDVLKREILEYFANIPATSPARYNHLYEGISTHSFRKWYATEIYKANGFDIALVQRLLQHSSATTTQRYIGIEPQRIEQAIQNHAQLI